MFEYIDLHFTIHEPWPRDEYPLERKVVITSKVAGEQIGTFVAPFPDDELARFLGMLDARSGTSNGIRRGTPEHRRIEEFGEAFFQALLKTPGVRSCYDRTWARIQEHDYLGLRIRLTCYDKQLLTFPWEILHDGSRFLFLSSRVVLIRYLPLPEPIIPISVDPPLRVLVAIANPRDLPPLNVEREVELIQRALRYLKGEVTIDLLKGANYRSLQARLTQAHANKRSFNVLHFIGHGRYDKLSKTGYLAFEDEEHHAEESSAKRLAQLLTSYPTLRLAVLNACQTTQADRYASYSGVTEAMLKAGMAAVITMQFPISDTTATRFADTFYEAIAAGLPVDAALGETRVAIYGDEDSLEFGTPALYARIDDGQIFKHQNLAGIKQSHYPSPETPRLGETPALAETIEPSEDELLEDLLSSDLVRIQRAASFIAEVGETEIFQSRLLGFFNNPAASYKQRIAIGRAFAFVGDPRNLEEMILVPAGRFWLGSDERYVQSMIDQRYRYFSFDETPIQRLYLPSFWIAKYPVTNKQYSEFLRANPGHPSPPHWENGRLPPELANHPVVQVSWDDAVAYARWHGKRLSSEFEWEKAARGRTRWQYPWGHESDHEKCNVQLAPGIIETTPVGIFPAGASPYGLFDMVGNVWEWTDSSYLPYPGNHHSSEDYNHQYRVMRGGSWWDPWVAARCTCRHRSDPRDKYTNVGFRLAKSVED